MIEKNPQLTFNFYFYFFSFIHPSEPIRPTPHTFRDRHMLASTLPKSVSTQKTLGDFHPDCEKRV